ncbi:SGNH/GDSL hydrolase family protein [Bordetella trematum]|uniref:SGNH/GDSL hydrolase family protein n=1 Tax=Bordetella trematum TaxID=123899 RepID=UPI003AF39F85
MLSSALAGLSLLVIGESHLTLNNHLREPLQQALLAEGAAHVRTIGACGASPARWLKATPVDCGAEQIDDKPAVVLGKEASTTAISELIQKSKPDVVVVIIGDTMGSYTKPVFPKTWAWQETTGLAKAIAATHTACVWVGPAWGTDGGPYGKNAQRTMELSRFLASNVAPCSYVDSLTFSKPGQWTTLDGQHFTQSGYASWAKAIADSLGKAPAIMSLEKKK